MNENLPLFGIGNPAGRVAAEARALFLKRAKVVWTVVQAANNIRSGIDAYDKQPPKTPEEMATMLETFVGPYAMARFKRIPYPQRESDAVTVGDGNDQVEMIPVWNKDP